MNLTKNVLDIVGLVLMAIGCFAVIVNLLDPIALAFGAQPSPNIAGCLVWGAIGLAGHLLRLYAQRKKQPTDKPDNEKK